MSDIGADQLATPELRIRLIGQFQVERSSAGDALVLPVGKATTIMQLLAVQRRSFVATDAIVEALWGEAAPVGAAQNIASLVSRLRRVVGSERIVGGRNGYRLETADCRVDVDEAERLVKEAETQLRGGRPTLAGAASKQALAVLEHGSLLEDEPYATWAEEGRRAVERLLRRARRTVWMAALGLGEHRTALDVATRAVEVDPLDEEAHRARMQALYLAGDAAAALAAYERVRDTLVEQLGADPGPETDALYLAVLRSERIVTLGAEPPPIAEARDASELVGRDRELATLTNRWAAAAGGRWGIVMVVGATGAGKTQLVGELVHRARTSGGAVLSAACHEAERSLFLQPVLGEPAESRLGYSRSATGFGRMTGT